MAKQDDEITPIQPGAGADEDLVLDGGDDVRGIANDDDDDDDDFDEDDEDLDEVEPEEGEGR